MVPQGHNFFHLTGLLGTLVTNRATVVRWTFTAVAGGIAGVRIVVRRDMLPRNQHVEC